MRLLGVGHAENTASHVPLAEVELDGALLGGGGLREGGGSTKGTSESRVLHADDADVGCTTSSSLAGHALGHLDLYR